MNRLVIIILIFLASSVNGQDWAGCTDCSGSSAPGTYPPDVLEIKSSNEGWLAKGSDGASGKKNHNSISRTYAAKSCYGKGWACYSHLMCIKFYNSKDRWDISEMYAEIPKMPEFNNVDDYFMMVECSPKGYNQNIGIKAPMIHLIVDDPFKRRYHLEEIWENYDLDGRGDKLADMLNTESTLGETFLDYLYFMAQYKASYGAGAKIFDAYRQIFYYACAKGGEFKKFRDKASCKNFPF